MHLLTLTDDAALRDVLRATLGEASCEFHPATLTPEGLEEALVRQPDALLLDLAGQVEEGLPFLRSYAERADRIPVIVVCPGNDRGTGLRALKEGAADYLLRPLSMEELAARLTRIQEVEHLRRETQSLRCALERNAARSTVVAEGPQMSRIRDSIAALAGRPEPVLLVGERGTGKKTLAEFLHRLDGERKTPVAIIPCHAVGARLFESPEWRAAQKSGSAILDGIQDLPRDQQDALADTIAHAAGQAPEAHQRPIRVIALTSLRLDDPAERKQFSPQLYEMFGSLVFVIPPLRERSSDVPALLAHFAQRTAQRLGRPVSVSPRALAMLAVYPWPGNVGELESSVERAALLGGNGRLEYADFGLVPGLAGPGDSASGALELKPQVEAFERQVLLQALAATKGNRQSAAKLLGISLRTLFYKIKRYGVEG